MEDIAQQKEVQALQQRKGQTLVEFAISLPIILILMFGIIEFGRIFQAWISIQNAARTAARYASTGRYENAYDNFILEDSLNSGVSDPESIVPCKPGGEMELAIERYNPVGEGPGSGFQVERFTGVNPNNEELFSTWWGKDCEPEDPIDGGPSNDQFLRTDLVRIPSIYASAVEGAGGLAVNTIDVAQIEDAADAATAENRLRKFLYAVWNPLYPLYQDPADPMMDTAFGLNPVRNPERLSREHPDFADRGSHKLRGYFSVMMCSTRSIDPNVENAWVDAHDRYITIYNPTEVNLDDYSTEDQAKMQEILDTYYSDGAPYHNRYTDMPGCFLNVEPVGAGGAGAINNRGTRWLDPGGPNDRVDIAVSFYHPLITPLGLAEFVPMHARRSAIVEAFRSANAPQDPSGSGSCDPATDPDCDAVIVETNTPTHTFTPSQTYTSTYTPTNTFTPTPSPVGTEQSFACNEVEFVMVDSDESLSDTDRLISFQPNRVLFRLHNNNTAPAYLRRVKLNWTSADYDGSNDPVPGSPTFFFDRFMLGSEPHWDGTDFRPETDTDEELGAIVSQDAMYIAPGAEVTWMAEYDSGPLLLDRVLPRSAFSGTEFWFSETPNGELCGGALEFTSTTDEVTENLTPTVDPETDCLSEDVEFGAVSDPFREFGWVQLYMTNNRASTSAPITDFEVQWGPWEDRDEPGSVKLQGIYIGGDTPFEGVQIWAAPNDEGVGIEKLTDNEGTLDDPNVYDPVRGADGTWTQRNYAIPPNATRNVWLDFNGENLAEDRNMILSDLNGTKFFALCPGTGEDGQGGDGDVPGGEVELINYPTPPPTIDPRNEPPVANDDTYQISAGSQSSVGAPGVLANDTDCADDSPGRIVQGPVCTGDISNPANHTDNGDEPLRVSSCLDGCRTNNLNIWIDMNPDGSFWMDVTNSDAICEASGIITDTYTYQIRDARGEHDTAVITFEIDAGNDPNRRPFPQNSTTYFLDTENGTQLGTSHGQDNLDRFFGDADGDTLSFSLAGTDTNPGSYDDDFTLNVNSNGTWTFTAGQAMVDRQDGSITRVEVTIKADDGQGKCSENWNTFVIEVMGSGDAPPEPTDPPPPTATEDTGSDNPGRDG